MDYSPLWLNWRPRPGLPAWAETVCADPATDQGKAAVRELLAGLQALTGGEADRRKPDGGQPCVRLIEEVGGSEGFDLCFSGGGCTLRGSGRGLLYGVFRLLRMLAAGQPLRDTHSEPTYPIRMLDHWDNDDGGIERGYSGRSFFFRGGRPFFSARTRDYARLLASCGLNGCCINNVNVRGNASKLVTGEYDEELRQIAACFEEYGVALWLSVNFAAPMELGGLDTADPCDERVRAWWAAASARLFAAVPNLAGFLVKADSEGRPGPHTYGRTHAEGANMLADAVAPFGGKVLWRCFVYNCTQDWRTTDADRARAQCDTFAPLDGLFRENVLLQIKNGPVDFQIREPVSPLFGRLDQTSSILEFQLAQEYTGQQRHVCYLMPMFREVLDFHLMHRAESDTVAEAVSAICAVSNTGDDFNWTGHDLAAANLFGFGALCWDPKAEPAAIAEEWSILTFGDDPTVTKTVTSILMDSRRVYESYTVPLGIGWMCKPGVHYGPDPDGYEYDRWGTYHRATCREIGVERGPGGTGYTEQYCEPLAAMYRDPATCPEELLLFFHRLPYTHRMKDGRTLIQAVYDSHFDGYEAAERMAASWDSLEGRIAADAFARVQARFCEQLTSAREWRDVINSWFYRLTLIPDEKGRALYI